MLNKLDPSLTDEWKQLQQHYGEMKHLHMKVLFDEDKNRFEAFSRDDGALLLDFSKNRVTKRTFNLLINLARACKVEEAIDEMYSGGEINETEGRPVLHVALRNRSNDQVTVNGRNVMDDVNRVLGQMGQFVKKLHSGEWKGFSGKGITDIVNIGIGGSHLGPSMAVEALKPYHQNVRAHFISNIDATDVTETLKPLDPETTLFIVASKTFTTQETITNAHTCRDWLLNKAGNKLHVKQHFVAVSTNPGAAMDFGIDEANIFEFWDWVGGRYSMWSAIGLPIACAIGMEHFEALLHGAHSMDQHFKGTDLENNIPVILALLSVWYNNFFGAETEAVLPYDQYLQLLPDYLQQLVMESNGKNTGRNGKHVTYHTGNIIWGAPGTNGQHSFYQLLHQGTRLVPCDFLAPAQPQHDAGPHHRILLSHFFAQTAALMNGKSLERVVKELKKEGLSTAEIEKMAMFRVFDGNRPTNSILYQKLSPAMLGALVAMYEHKTFVQGVIWNIFSFDQWGVELGKQLAQKILPTLEGDEKTDNQDASTNGLINWYKAKRKPG